MCSRKRIRKILKRTIRQVLSASLLSVTELLHCHRAPSGVLRFSSPSHAAAATRSAAVPLSSLLSGDFFHLRRLLVRFRWLSEVDY